MLVETLWKEFPECLPSVILQIAHETGTVKSFIYRVMSDPRGLVTLFAGLAA
jgi:hypothetical protein